MTAASGVLFLKYASAKISHKCSYEITSQHVTIIQGDRGVLKERVLKYSLKNDFVPLLNNKMFEKLYLMTMLVFLSCV